MDVIAALQARKSVRAFLDKPVEEETIRQLLDAARWSPSGTNAQPWEVLVLRGERMHQLQQKIEAAFRDGVPPQNEYNYYPDEWIEPFLGRRRACGLQLYQALDIKREDKERRQDQWIANYHAFGAPVMFLFLMERVMKTGSFMDFGMFLQSIMLAALDLDLATCPQAAFCDYTHLIKQDLGIGDDKILVCGMALGYEDQSADVNSYRTPREPVESFTRFID